jgi:hypothetical protein
MPIVVHRAAVLTLWAAVVAERLGHSRETAVTIGRALVGSAPRENARGIACDENGANESTETQQLVKVRVSPSVVLLGKAIRMILNAAGEPRAAVRHWPVDHRQVEQYLTKAFGDHLVGVRAAMEELASRYEPADLNQIGLSLYEKFRPGMWWGRKSDLEIWKILAAV